MVGYSCVVIVSRSLLSDLGRSAYVIVLVDQSMWGLCCVIDHCCVGSVGGLLLDGFLSMDLCLCLFVLDQMVNGGEVLIMTGEEEMNEPPPLGFVRSADSCLLSGGGP